MGSDSAKNIVIVGGGFGGLSVFNALSPKLIAPKYKDVNLILVNQRSFFAHLPATLRMSVTDEGKLEDSVLMPYLQPVKGKGKGEIITGKVVRIREEVSDDGAVQGVVSLEDGKEINYNVLVLATGNVWPGPVNLPDTREDVAEAAKQWRAKFKDAKSVLLVGGGAIGTELAGEIKEFYPKTPVTIVHGTEYLFNDAYPVKWRKAITQKVKAKGINVILSDFVDSVDAEDGKVTTRSGTKIDADLVIPTWGGKPNTKLIADALGADVLVSSGHLATEKTLQVKNHPRIFAVGDIIEWKEQKQAAKAPSHGAVVATNILSILDGKPAKATYGGSSEMILVTLGKTGGSAYLGILWGLTFGDWFARMMKSQTLLTEMMRGSYKLGKF